MMKSVYKNNYCLIKQMNISSQKENKQWFKEYETFKRIYKYLQC